MKRRVCWCHWLLGAAATISVTTGNSVGQTPAAPPAAATPFTMRPPLVPPAFAVKLYAHDPMLHNPCALCFDDRGRMTVSHGPQYRSPKLDTPGDQVLILIDDNDDGVADRSVVFAEGLNNVQGMAWRGDQLWIANSPELTSVRDLDGDDRADEYVRVYTDLGNLEHGLHGLNWAPDGLLYMSKGNSKGHNRPDEDGRVAPRAFRELMGQEHPVGAPDDPDSPTFTREDYLTKGKGYHDPADDWGRQGGILRCNSLGRQLEIVARGFRNPWDITMDDEFTWLGTDNDQDLGDKVFTPFFGAHFGWGHAWSYNWTGDDHLPTIPTSAPLFEGSGTGVHFYTGTQFPEPYRHVFFVNDWASLRTNVFRTRWDGAHRVPSDPVAPWQEFAREDGRGLYRPTDIEMGPDGALYVASWGHDTGAQVEATEHGSVQVDEGRVFKIWYDKRPLPRRTDWWRAHRSQPRAQWSVHELLADFGPDSLPVWRTNAQVELVRRGAEVHPALVETLRSNSLAKISQTWIIGTLGQIPAAHTDLTQLAEDSRPQHAHLRRQAIGALAQLARSEPTTGLPAGVMKAVQDSDPRTRFAAVQAIWQAGDRQHTGELVEAAARETDRIVDYTLWHALQDLMPADARRALLTDPRKGVRRAALFGLMDRFEISKEDVLRHIETEVDPVSQKWGLKWVLSASPPRYVSNRPERVASKDNLQAEDVVKYLGTATSVSTRTGLWSMLADLRPTGDIWDSARRIYHRGFVEGWIQPSEQTVALRALAHDPRAVRLAFSLLSDHYLGIRDKQLGKKPSADPLDVAAKDALRAAAWDVMTNNPAAPDFLLKILPHSALIESRHHGVMALAAWAPSATRWPADPELLSLLEGTYITATDPRLQSAVVSVLLALDETKARTWAESRASMRELVASVASHGDVRVYSLAERLARHLAVPIEVPERSPVTIEQVLGELPQANAQRGEQLFFDKQRANCGACHQVGARGTAIAPSLADIGRRALPQEIAESVLHPSRKIVQGFAVTHFTMDDGRVVSGVIRSETDTILQLFKGDGTSIEIRKDQVEERMASDISIMPSSFGLLLSSQEIADVIAWLMTQQAPLAPVPAHAPHEAPPATIPTLEMARLPDQVRVSVNGQPLVTYRFQDPLITRPFFSHVHAPGGIQVSRNHPPRGDDPKDHAELHPGLFLAFGDIQGHDYWRLGAKVVHQEFVQPPRADGATGSFAVKNHYLSKDGDRVVCEEIARYHFTASGNIYRIDWDSTFRSESGSFNFGDQEEMGLGIRLASALRETGGNGSFLNSAGQRGAAGTWGQPADWCLVSGEIGEPVRVMLMAAPYNLRPSWWHNRAYGLCVANLFGRAAMKQGEPSEIVVPQGDSFRLGYGILVVTSPNPDFDPATQYRDYCQSLTDSAAENRSD